MAPTSLSDSKPGAPPNRWVWFAIVGLLLATFAAYHNSLSGALVFDDELSIVENLTIRKLWPPSTVLNPPRGAGLTVEGRPVLNLSLALDYAIGGPTVTSYHVTNLAIHACATLALFGVVRRILISRRWSQRFSASVPFIALTASLWWAVHPLQTESVTYIIQRAESLTGLFFLLTFYCFVRGADPAEAGWRSTWLVLSLFACALGMGTKETMVTAPLLVLLFDRTFLAGSIRDAWRQRRAFYVGLIGTWGLLALLIAEGGGNRSGTIGAGVGIGWWEYWLTQFKAIACYLKLSVWPQPLVFEYGTFWVGNAADIVPAALLVVPLAAGTVVLLVQNRAIGFLGAWFFGILAPTSLAPGTTQMIVEHRVYLSLAALSVLGATGLDALCSSRWRKILGSVTAGALAVAFILLTAARNTDYLDPVILWRDTIAKRPDNPLAHYMLAETLDRRNDTSAAIAHLRETLRLKPGFSVAHARLGDVFLKLGQRTDAIEQYRAALVARPDFADAHASLGTALAQDGRLAEGIEHLETAVRLDPKFAKGHYNLGNALAEAGRSVEAIPHYESAIRLEPANAAAHYNLANTLVAADQLAAAVKHYDAALALRPGHAPTHYNYANLLARLRRLPEAIAHYEAALAANPNYPEAHNNLGSALLELNRREEAIAHYEAALRLAPDFAAARANLTRLRNAAR